jgi:hypothetical protein
MEIVECHHFCFSIATQQQKYHVIYRRIQLDEITGKQLSLWLTVIRDQE